MLLASITPFLCVKEPDSRHEVNDFSNVPIFRLTLLIICANRRGVSCALVSCVTTVNNGFDVIWGKIKGRKDFDSME